MAFASSGAFGLTLKDVFQNDTAADWPADTFKIALFTNSITSPNFDTNTAYGAAPFDANEVPNGSGYTTGGAALTTPTLTVSSGVLVWDAVDSSWTSASFTARGGLIYDDTITTPTADPALFAIAFGQDYTATNGTFLVTYDATGIARLDYTP